MPRRRWLPENVTPYKDRHGKTRYRFRKRGLPSYSFRHAPGTPEFMTEYEQARTGQHDKPDRFAAYTYDALISSFYRTPKWLEMRASSQATYRGIIERFRAKNGDKDVRHVTTASIESKLAKMSETPAAANNLRKALSRLHRHAIKLGWRIDNPVAATDAYKSGKGWHAWTEAEIAAYQATWPIGTKERLALEILLWTGLRESDAVTLSKEQRRGDVLFLTHTKNSSDTEIALAPDLALAMAACDSGAPTYLATHTGKPYTPKGFYNWFKRACVKAGVGNCSPHGVRKAISRRLAEAGATPLEGRALTGHKTDKMFAYYAESANKRDMAGVAMGKVVANQKERFATKGAKDE